MKLEYFQDERSIRLKLDSEVDHHSCNEIKREVDFDIQKYSPKVLVVDFDDVHFMDSSGIGMLIGRYKLMLRYGGEIIMINVRSDIRRILEMSGILKIIPIVEEVCR